MAARYSFRTTWRVDAAPQRVWRELERAIAGESDGWWPGFRVESPGAPAPGGVIGVVVRAPFGYRLRFSLRITDIVPARRLEAASGGDLDGRGSVEVGPRGGGSEIRFAWDVAVRRRWMRVTGSVLRPVFALAHGMVMRAGERGLRRAVAVGR
ncbi:hypothetical protein B5M43_001020 [Microbacterium sp. MEC084]|uniref:SRPBCC family protein n=1 Tax=Microbacterium sp. MEC084 TaxID=1963027 RepID=UPI001070424E|nr:SRPBCC family protein [Microbacterium sp. MEC084]MCD1267436.1 hypothetical protein [Microbacterium sp. MEC084]